MKESTVERNIRRQVEGLGGVAWKWVSPGRRGVPDRICILPGPHIIFVELVVVFECKRAALGNCAKV